MNLFNSRLDIADMKSLLFARLIACVLATPLAARADDTAQILELEQRFGQALRGNWDALEELLDEDFFYNTAEGTSVVKKPFIAHMRTGAVQLGTVTRKETRVRRHDHVAVVTGVSRVQVRIDGAAREIGARHLHVWVHREKGWQLTARQVTYTHSSP